MYALAEIDSDARSLYDYTGYSERRWDTLATEKDAAGMVELQCVNGHLWRAAEDRAL